MMQVSQRGSILLAFTVWTWSVQVGAESPSPVKLRSLAISAYEANNAVIQSLSATIHETLEDAGVNATVVSKYPLSDGRNLELVRHPSQEVTTSVTLSGNKQRLVRKFSTPSISGSDHEDFWAADGRWVQYVPGIKAAWINHMSNTPRMLPMSPLQVGSTILHLTLPDCLRQEKLVSGSFVTLKQDGQAIQLVTQDIYGETIIRHFGANAAFLPIRWEMHWPDGSLLQSVEYQYANVLDGKAKILHRLIRRFYKQGAAAEVGAPGWHQQITRHITVREINHAVPSSVFQASFPVGTRVTDNTKGTVYEVASQSPTSTSRRSPMWGIVATLSVIVSLAGIYAFKR